MRFRATCARQMPAWRKQYPGVEELRLAVMGCIVNGPGESKHANLGISLPGTFEDPKAPVYVDGKLFTTLRGETIVAEFKQILDSYVESHYGKTAGRGRIRPQTPCLKERILDSHTFHYLPMLHVFGIKIGAAGL